MKTSIFMSIHNTWDFETLGPIMELLSQSQSVTYHYTVHDGYAVKALTHHEQWW